MKGSLLILLTSALFAQTYERTCAFQDTAQVNSYIDLNLTRFTPSNSDILKADSLTMLYIKSHKKEHPRAHQEITDFGSYYRQYVGYLNKENQKIIYLNSSCRMFPNWRTDIISVMGGGSCYFNVRVNLAKCECYEFIVNDLK